jgi:hypothetical protein
VTEKERWDDGRKKKRRHRRLPLDSIKAEWPVSRRLTLAGSGLVGLVVIALAWSIFHQTQSHIQPTTAEVRREPISSAGPNPFMSPVGHDQPNITAVTNTGGAFSGNTPGLYGETGDKQSCDAQSLLTNLQADRAKADAWADALGLHPQDIPSYVASLVPVVLRSDTAVTSYGYADDHFFAYPAVLQAGTAVLINSYGEPKVKCFSGNPLTAPMSYPQASYQASYVGPIWQDFQPTSITLIQRTPTIINNYTIVNVVTRSITYRPAPRPQHNDNNWYCKKYPDSDKCQDGTRGKPPIIHAPPPKAPPVDTPPVVHAPPPKAPPVTGHHPGESGTPGNFGNLRKIDQPTSQE